MIAYLCRYGHQPLDTLLATNLRNLRKLYDAISRLITRENNAARP